MYKPLDKTTWKGRVDLQEDELGLRWHQIIQLLDLSGQVPPANGHIAFLGFCCEEGVRRNQGRVGAAAGPAAIRLAMGSFADHLPAEVQLFDGGDVLCPNQHLEEAQAQLGRKVEFLLQKGFKTIVLGGGHETAYGHFLGIQKNLKAGENLGIINLDAHFDLRSYAQGPSSGTPFRQISDDLHAAQRPFHYLCLGIQEYGNTRQLFKTATELGTEYVTAQEMQSGAVELVQKKLQQFMAKVDKLYLSIDLDVFAAAYAPGVSATNAFGLPPHTALPFLTQIISSGKVISFDVVELNPTLDRDNQTAKLAATLVYHLVQAWGKSPC
jgi:formiminoglutamase